MSVHRIDANQAKMNALAQASHSAPPAKDSTVKSVTQAQPAAQATPVNKESTQPKPQPTTDTVKLSNAALVAAQEATETPTQTLKEANSGDRQAQRLLAKEAAAKAAAK
ncbi:MAG TPA: hypothetical protein VKF36_14015 [Syntrophorhabdales bacterium]|nr:hypothetical protein [Syntrophorhabdales bacterium]